MVERVAAVRELDGPGTEPRPAAVAPAALRFVLLQRAAVSECLFVQRVEIRIDRPQ